MKDLKQAVLETLKTKGYHEHQLRELNPIIQATIEATKQALSLGAFVGQGEQLVAFLEFVVDYKMLEVDLEYEEIAKRFLGD
jgi:hypothetical protein